MHVGFLTLEYPPPPTGGIGTQTRTLARALAADGHRVTVVGWGREAAYEDRGVRVRFQGHTRIPRAGWWLHRRRAARALHRAVRCEGLEIVEAHDWCGPSAGLQLPCPVVVRCHGSATYFAHLEGTRVRPSLRWAERLALRGADAVAAVSRYSADLTAELFALDPGAFTVVPNGVDADAFHPAPASAIERDEILYVGSVVRKKGIVELCRAFSLLVERRPEARLRVVGRDTPDRATGAPSTWAVAWEQLSARAREQAEHLGPRGQGEVRELLRRAAVCCFPSHAEALPMTWIEAMASGRPVVAFDVGWAPEVLDSSTGLLVPHRDVESLAAALGGLLRNPEAADALGAAARRRVEERFTAERMATASLDWYRSVLGRRRGRR